MSMKFMLNKLREDFMTKCPKCGYERKKIDSIISDAECPKCGIFYHKWKPPIVAENDEPIKKSSELLPPQNSDVTIATEETYKDSGWVSFINILALLLIIDSTLVFLRLIMGVSGIFGNTNLPLQYQLKYFYDILIAVALFFSAFGLFLRMKWARIAVIVMLSLWLVEGFYIIVNKYLAFNTLEKQMHESFSEGKKNLYPKLLFCFLCVYFIVKLSSRKVGASFRSGIWKPSTISESDKPIKNKAEHQRQQKKPSIPAINKTTLIAIILLVVIIGTTVAITQLAKKYSGQTAQSVVSGQAVQAIAAGRSHTLALSNEGIVWAWGDNLLGQLGDGTRGEMRAYPLPLDELKDVISIAAGVQFSVALKNDGTVWAWGDNEFGQLGDGSGYVNTVRPVQAADLTGIISIAAGNKHTVALKNDGSVWTWGNNSLGELGDGTKVNRITPVRLPDLNDVIAISSKFQHTLALKRDGTVWAWGNNSVGQLGDGTTTSKYAPVQVIGISDVSAISAGDTFSAAIKKDGSVWIWGFDYEKYAKKIKDIEGYSELTPRLLHTDTIPIAIAAGYEHLLMLNKDGTIQTYGNNLFGERGKLENFKNVTKIAGGKYNSFAIREDQSLWAWGYNEFGQLGDGTSGRKERKSPQYEKLNLSKANPIRVKEFVAAPSGQTQAQVTASSAPTSASVIAIACGDHYSIALKSDNTVWSWGDNEYYQLGRDVHNNAIVPGDRAYAPGQLKDISDVISVSGGVEHAIALKRDNTVVQWGRSLNDMLYSLKINSMSLSERIGYDRRVSGDRGKPRISRDKRRIENLTNVVAVSAGRGFSLALKSDGTVWAWGWNGLGELGNGSIEPSEIPIQVEELMDVKAIAAGRDNDGRNYAMALKRNGTVWAWGFIKHAEYPNMKDGVSTLPIQVRGLENVTAISAGIDALALKNDGTVWRCWTTKRAVLDALNASPVIGLDDIREIASSSNHSVALKSDGTVWTWGNNDLGQLGDGTKKSRSSPVQVAELTNVIAIATGYWHTMVIKQDGTVWAWGDNSKGQLGKETLTFSAFPSQLDKF